MRSRRLLRAQLCGPLPKGFDPKAYVTRPWKITAYIHDGDQFDLGGRTIEVIATPGHTPDAISLIDRANGLLFTGDTYYPAPIWLYRPETDLDAYAKSIRRLAALAPQIKLVLGAHNVPVAPPSVLPRLVVAFDAVRAGTVPATPDSPGKVIYKVDGFSFLMRAAGTSKDAPSGLKPDSFRALYAALKGCSSPVMRTLMRTSFNVSAACKALPSSSPFCTARDNPGETS